MTLHEQIYQLYYCNSKHELTYLCICKSNLTSVSCSESWCTLKRNPAIICTNNAICILYITISNINTYADTLVRKACCHLSSSFHWVPKITNHHSGLIRSLKGTGQSGQCLRYRNNTWTVKQIEIMSQNSIEILLINQSMFD